ncbi:hypothetical protein [Pectinatus frisingensis]|uniref:hypothetical protein n=1 Tax=Pectinatus frisingensis TaxID=865 RepID=UPI0018C65F40|nr:hypothetical protein [Pectinatus frisingensis]
MDNVKFYEVNNGTEIIACHLDINDTRKWYKKEFGEAVENIEEISPNTPMFDEVDIKPNNITLLPVKECHIGNYAAVQGAIYEKVRIIDCWTRQGSPQDAFIIAGTEY